MRRQRSPAYRLLQSISHVAAPQRPPARAHLRYRDLTASWRRRGADDAAVRPAFLVVEDRRKHSARLDVIICERGRPRAVHAASPDSSARPRPRPGHVSGVAALVGRGVRGPFWGHCSAAAAGSLVLVLGALRSLTLGHGMSELPRHGSQAAGHGGGGKERISASSGHRSSAMARGEGSGRRKRAGYREETLSSGGLEGRRLVCGENHALGSPVAQTPAPPHPATRNRPPTRNHCGGAVQLVHSDLPALLASVSHAVTSPFARPSLTARQ